MLRVRIAESGEPEIVPEFHDPYLELLRILREAAEIEHALMVQYLYSAFSVRPVYRAKLAGTGGFPTARNITGVAVQEMAHLAAVNELLVALGAAPCLIRQDFPYEPAIYPFPFELERLTPASVAKYTWAEAPADAVTESAPGEPPTLLDELRQALGAELRPNHVGGIYRTMIRLLGDVAAAPPPRFPDVTMWTARLNQILDQGEHDHFLFFKSVFLGDHVAFAGVADVWSLDPDDPKYPSNPVPTNPIAFPAGDAPEPRAIADESVRRLAWLGDLQYWLILMLIDLSYRYGVPTLSLAQDHMTGALRLIGFGLADQGQAPTFDPLSMGYAPGLDRAGSIEIIKRIIVDAAVASTALAADGLLPADYDRGLGDATTAALGAQ